MKPAEFLDAHEKLLLGVATKGGILLFYVGCCSILVLYTLLSFWNSDSGSYRVHCNSRNSVVKLFNAVSFLCFMLFCFPVSVVNECAVY